MPALIAAVKAKLATPKPQPTPAPADEEDLMLAKPAQLVQRKGDDAIYALTLRGLVHVKNSYHLWALRESGQVTELVWTISADQFNDLNEKE